MKFYESLLKFSASVFVFIALVLSSANPSFASQGGRSGNGGGTGVACFATRQAAQKARELRAEGKPLPRKLLKQMTLLETTEVIEHIGHFVYPGINPEDYDSSAFLAKILKVYLEPVAPSLYHKLLDILENHFTLDDPSNQTDHTPLIPIDDTGPVPGVGPDSTCAVVQIVVRHAETLPNGKIVSSVSLDRDLYTMLGTNRLMQVSEASLKADRVISQAALKLHEALYLLGYGLGQTTSEKVQAMVFFLMSYDNLIRINQVQSSLEAAKLAEHIRRNEWHAEDSDVSVNVAGAIVISSELFKMGLADFPIVDTGPLSERATELHRAYLSVEQSLIDPVVINSGALNGDIFRIHSIALRAQSFTDSEAFILSAYLALVAGKINDLYALLDPSVDSTKVFEDTCKYAEMLGSTNVPKETRDLWFSTLLKTKNYCEAKRDAKTP